MRLDCILKWVMYVPWQGESEWIVTFELLELVHSISPQRSLSPPNMHHSLMASKLNPYEAVDKIRRTHHSVRPSPQSSIARHHHTHLPLTSCYPCSPVNLNSVEAAC